MLVKNNYASAAALTTFCANAPPLTDRKNDVTFVGRDTAAGLAAGPKTLIFRG